jgi:alanyl-tRNA synthetase
MEERKRLERELGDAKRKLAMGGGAGKDGGSEAREIAGVKLLTRAVEGIDAKDLKSLVDDAKKSLGSGIVAFASASPDGKAGIVVGVTDDLVEKYSAVEFVRAASVALGGKGGGGRPDLAQAGGPDAAGINQALASVEDALRAKAAQ